MLVLSRKVRERILVSETIRVTVVQSAKNGRLRLEIDAPPEVTVTRGAMDKDHEAELLRDIEEIARMEELLAKARDVARKHEEQLRQVLSEPTSQPKTPPERLSNSCIPVSSRCSNSSGSGVYQRGSRHAVVPERQDH